MMEKSVEIDQKLCTGCGSCIRMCPAGIIYLDNSTKTAKIAVTGLRGAYVYARPAQ
jgi:Fe-S-cluster-containing hydrogenase component 2